MPSIITSEKIQKHNVDRYNFKVLSLGSESQEEAEKTFLSSNPASKEEKKVEREVDTSGISQSSKDSLIESLLNKTDEMSSNFIKLQMKLESMSDEHKAELKKVKDESYAAGLEAGKALALKEEDKNMVNALSLYASSIVKLESSAKEFESALEEIKKELIGAALDISKEVIKVELSENSSKVAITLSGELIKELQSSSKIILKVNPADHGAISQATGSLAHVEVMSDSAVSLGGVIAISDAGNIDAQIAKRFERVKRVALSE
ncbi:flagellar assembly protein FliH [Sulfurimonas sp. RIFOXYB12_FULL_35_9]|uniref:flagellar assembly protein FliH n=1 Tax=Sulfurimonas sp. RIFOXYB12_FULL_35_9 TaxID=1802256 RepID=UPI0008D15AD0|nr:flagellar assembly protein FliH [Sulfurimonas sp. RIFOXYB12_FULL_35_9]OHE04334.1 MAG: flagellar assembly protein FliH [Sulfurimonas sp. RIFOXYB12_FULL_35_9]